MHSQLYLRGRVSGNLERSTTKKGKLWVKLLLETELVRETRPGEYQSENVLVPINCFSREAEQVKGLAAGDKVMLGVHLYGTQFETDGGAVKRGVQIVADVVFTGGSQR